LARRGANSAAEGTMVEPSLAAGLTSCGNRVGIWRTANSDGLKLAVIIELHGGRL